MKLRYILFFLIIASMQKGYFLSQVEDDVFPNDFLFGVATASYQIEGAWNVSDKGESIWDRYTHVHPERIFDGRNGDVAADSYRLWQEDVEEVARLGVHFYRLSIAWPRVLPAGVRGPISKSGITYYRRLFERLISRNVQPVVTLYHWDLPQPLQDLGGWTNPLMADYFLDYAQLMFEKFGDLVKVWITFNEPLSFCQEGYGGMQAPGHAASGTEDYMCGHTVLRAHAMVYRLYERHYRHSQKGIVGITLDFSWRQPTSKQDRDETAAERARQFVFGWFAHPIFSKSGDYPTTMRDRIDDNSAAQNYTRSRLPVFTAEELKSLRGSADFLGLNHYTTYLVAEGNGEVASKPSFENDMGVVVTQDPKWPKSNSTWLKVVPWGFRQSLNYIRANFNNPPVLVTENGISTKKGLKDPERIAYIEGYLRELLAALRDGCDIMGYTYWSLIDNFEWTRGYSERFGLIEIDYESPNKTRTPRDSAVYYAEVIRTGRLPPTPNYYSYHH